MISSILPAPPQASPQVPHHLRTCPCPCPWEAPGWRALGSVAFPISSGSLGSEKAVSISTGEAVETPQGLRGNEGAIILAPPPPK